LILIIFASSNWGAIKREGAKQELGSKSYYSHIPVSQQYFWIMGDGARSKLGGMG
jgi:hypothetical protein